MHGFWGREDMRGYLNRGFHMGIEGALDRDMTVNDMTVNDMTMNDMRMNDMRMSTAHHNPHIHHTYINTSCKASAKPGTVGAMLSNCVSSCNP